MFKLVRSSSTDRSVFSLSLHTNSNVYVVIYTIKYILSHYIKNAGLTQTCTCLIRNFVQV
jgi:hypothetical protein